MIDKDLERQILERKLNFLRNVVIQRGDKIQSLRVLIKKKNITLSDDELLERIKFLQEQVKYQEFLEKKLVEIIGCIS
ncbi:hypothetical protein F975_01400 [Acinetobacter sp. ANC 3789]|uniref:hypothetical protein n=1 Tax=Acinetobacter sp. ANC 3789 TaxID=1217714 RepID=UPI0002D07F2B|nr:hypothetical protein [Acinetobacter sp. ANC 3789]ENU80852.1 hypothetical protein F975_01400 [Acinetobacter sp. ANC 3789]